jgi:hypothetical protein
MEEFEVLLNGTLRLTRGEQGMVYPVVDGRLLLSKGVAFKPGAGGRCVELDIEVDTGAFHHRVEELSGASGLFRVEA